MTTDTECNRRHDIILEDQRNMWKRLDKTDTKFTAILTGIVLTCLSSMAGLALIIVKVIK